MRILFLAPFAVAAHAASIDLVFNGNFEDGLLGWATQTNPANAPNSWFAASSTTDDYTYTCGNIYMGCEDTGTMGVYNGSLMATTGCATSTPCGLSQNLATVAGDTYTISFAFNPGYFVSSQYPGSGDTVVYFGSTQLIDLSNGPEGWTYYTFDNVTAASGGTTLQFSGFQNPAHSGVDAVSVIGEAQTPEPSSMVMAGFCLTLLGARIRRRA